MRTNTYTFLVYEIKYDQRVPFFHFYSFSQLTIFNKEENLFLHNNKTDNTEQNDFMRKSTNISCNSI